MRAIIFNVVIFILTLLSNGYATIGDNDFVVKFLFSFPDEQDEKAELSNPQAIAVNAEGHIYIADTGNSRIVKFDQKGNFIFAIGGFGWEKEQFDQPLDITAKTGLDVFVADFNNERLERYDKKLNYLSSFISNEAWANNLQFGFPSGVDISKHGELFICDNENNRILKLDAFGKPLLSFGDFNWGDGQLEFPIKVEVTLNDYVYVSDHTANQIIVFDYYGNFASNFGNKFLNQPNGLSWSKDGLLYVADSGNNRLVVFNSGHHMVFAWGSEGDKNGAFKNPVDVTTFEEKIYVLDSGNNRIQVFELNKN